MDVEEMLDRNGKPMFRITSPKHKNAFRVQKSEDGYCFYEVMIESGKLPMQLQGRFLTFNSGLQAVTDYLKNCKKSLAKRRDDTYEENHSVGSVSKSDDKE